MFQTENVPASIAHLNVRKEKHGDESQLAVDVKFETQASNEILESIQPGLRESLFRQPGKGEQQALPIDGNTLTAVKFPSLEPVKLTHEFMGYEVEIGGDLEATEAIVLVDVKLKKLAIDPIEGGSVALTFTASCEAEANDVADLADALIREGVRLTLRPPARQAEDNDVDDQQDAA